jgi:hypothetical protein
LAEKISPHFNTIFSFGIVFCQFSTIWCKMSPIHAKPFSGWSLMMLHQKTRNVSLLRVCTTNDDQLTQCENINTLWSYLSKLFRK